MKMTTSFLIIKNELVEVKERENDTSCDITADTIIIERDDNDHDNDYDNDYDTDNEMCILRDDMYEFRNKLSGLRQHNVELVHQIQTMECREECTNARIENLESTVAELVRYINKKG